MKLSLKPENVVRIKGLQSVSTSEALCNKTRLGLYFGGRWCGHCPPFSARLRAFYETYSRIDPNFEVIYISSHDSRAVAEQYFTEEHGNWLMMSHMDAANQFPRLMKEFGAQGIPTLVIVTENGTFITDEGRDIVTTTPPHDVGQDEMFHCLHVDQEVELSKIGNTERALLSLKYQKFTVRGFDEDGDPYVSLEESMGALRRHHLQPVKCVCPGEEVSFEITISSKGDAETEFRAAVENHQLSDGISVHYVQVTDDNGAKVKIEPWQTIPESMRYPVSVKFMIDKPRFCSSETAGMRKRELTQSCE